MGWFSGEFYDFGFQRRTVARSLNTLADMNRLVKVIYYNLMGLRVGKGQVTV
jgi:hypothetical protein